MGVAGDDEARPTVCEFGLLCPVTVCVFNRAHSPTAPDLPCPATVGLLSILRSQLATQHA
jgi:hypothetical protein